MSYEYWEKAMANPAALHAREFSITTTPEPGFYRTYRLHEPVAIYRDDDGDGLHVLVNGVLINVNEHETVWLSCAKLPVSEEWYRIVEAGGIWPDLDEAVAGIGHNRRRADDPESLIAEMATAASEYVSIDDDEMAARAMSLRSALLEQHKKVDGMREAEKAPHLKAAKKVDEQWMHIVKRAKAGADYLRGLVETYETRKRKLAREAMVTESVTPEPKAQIRSGYGRAVSVSEKPVVVGITNVTALVHYLQHSSAQQEMLFAYLMELAQKEVNSGATVPGVTVEMKAVLR
jgi:hypothetical protein